MKQVLISYFLVVILLTSAWGDEFQVNTRASLDQAGPDVAVCENGGFVVIWRSYRQDGSSNGIFARRFDPNCCPAGEEFQVNTTTAGNQTEPAVVMDDAGNFVVTWHGPGVIDPNQEDIFARWFDPNGSPVTEELQINDDSIDRQLYPAVAAGNNGGSVIVWESRDFPVQGDRAICGRMYNVTGETSGDEFIVNEEPSNCRYPDVAMDPNGNFAVVWLDDGSSNSIMARIFYADGFAKTDTFEVGTTGFSSVTQPAVAMDAAGCFIVTWDGDPNLASLDDIHARAFDPNGAALGEQFVVNTTLELAQQNPQVAMNEQGQFVIVWECMTDPNENDRDIFGRQYNCLDEPVGDEFQLNIYLQDDQRCPAVAIAKDGRFVTAWQSDEQDGSRFGIFAAVGYIVEPEDIDNGIDGSSDY